MGEPATYNIIVLLMPPLAAFCAYLLCRRVSGALWSSVLGGYIFGFSPYVLGEMLGHLDLAAIFIVPLIALVTLKRLDGEISGRRFAILLAALLTAQFLFFPELFATITLVGGFSLLLALAIFDGDTRTKLRHLIAPIIMGYAISTVLLSPYFYYMLAFEHPSGSIWPPTYFSADLVGFLVPRRTVWWGSAKFATAISSHFAGFILENGDYLGIVLIVFIEVFRRRFWPTKAGKFLTILLLTIIVAAMGSTLHIRGFQGFPLPWAIFQHLPLIENILPVRFMMYAFLVIATMAAMWFASSSARRLTKFVVAAAIVISIAPNPHASFWVTPLDLPAFFADRTYATELEPGETIFAVAVGAERQQHVLAAEKRHVFSDGGRMDRIRPFRIHSNAGDQLFLRRDRPARGR